MQAVSITAVKAQLAELADRVAREHDHVMIIRKGRADVMLIAVAEYESMRETLDVLSDDEAFADLRQSQEDFASGDTFTVEEVGAELESKKSLSDPAQSGSAPVRGVRAARPPGPGERQYR